jgi:hypothetical protein
MKTPLFFQNKMKFNFNIFISSTLVIFTCALNAQAQDSSNSNQSMGLGGFLGQLKELGGAVAENVGKHIEFRVNQENSASSADGYKNSNISERNQLEVYKTLDGSSSKLNNIFNDSNKEDTSITKKEMGWPRVAISFSKWGPKLDCWQGRAEIWLNFKNKISEDFEACHVKYSLVDDIGRKSYLTDHAEQMAIGMMQSYKPHYNVKSTGEVRTAGPTPPLNPLNVNIANDGTRETGLIVLKLNKILLNIGLYSGFLSKEISTPSGGLTANKLDARLWFYKFDLNGRVD